MNKYKFYHPFNEFIFHNAANCKAYEFYINYYIYIFLNKNE